MSNKNRIRLFASTPLELGESYVCDASQTHYLQNVMRQNVGDRIFLFDGQNGEFEGIISELSKKRVVIDVQNKILDYTQSPDVWLLFAPVKKEKTDIVIQKAVELGVSKLVPVQTEYTIMHQLKTERMTAQIIEAAEQCRRQDIPKLENMQLLQQMLSNWDKKRKLAFLDETGTGQSFAHCAHNLSAPVAFLVGPEGGFSKKELEILKNMPYTIPISLGKRILRSETAAIAALSCWQMTNGDWK